MQMRLKDGKEKVLTFSYDDGNTQDIRLIEIFRKYGLKGTFNLNTGLFLDEAPEGTGGRKLTWEEAKALYIPNGQEAAVHTLTHPWLVSLSQPEIVREVTEDRKNIEKNFGVICRGMAYPFGCYNENTEEALKTAGIVYSRTAGSTHRFDFPDNWLELTGTCHHDDPKLMELAKEFAANDARWDICRMFYIWGHSYEFDRNDNWELIEHFGEYIGNREDIWYATNIEIYDYVTAYKSLEVSYDGDIIHNPSAQTVWFSAKGKTHKIEPNETLSI